MKSLPIIAVLILSMIISRLDAYGEPFATDLLSTLTFTEKYSESVGGNATDGYTLVPTSAINITGGKFSLTGVSVDQSTPISISVGKFYFSGNLGNDPALGDVTDFTTGVSTLPVYSSYRTDSQGNPLSVGTVKVTWTAAAMSFVVNVTSTEYFADADSYSGYDWGTLDQTSIACTISFADRVMDSRAVFYGGTNSRVNSLNSPSGTLTKVDLAGGFDSTAPVPAIVTPAANAKVYYPIIFVDGSATDSQSGPNTVRFKVNSGPVTELVTDPDGYWNLPLDSLDTLAHLNEGKNTLNIQATDMDGNVSAWISTTVTYSKISPLALKTSGSGTLSAYSGTTNQMSGSLLTVTANPAEGYVFDHWSGSIGPVSILDTATPLFSSSAKLTFTMQPGTSLKATFIPSPFIGITGNYTGLLVSGTQPNAKGGSFSLKLTSFGTFTGKLTLAGVAYSIKGQFNNSGHFSGAFGTKVPLQLTLDFNPNDGSKKITGTATAADNTATITSDLAVFHPDLNPFTSGTGSYTFLIPAITPGDTTTPQGTGYGTASIDSAGLVKVSGVLGDGTKFKTSSSLSKDLSFPLFVPVYKTGALSGNLQLHAIAGVSDFNGNLTWVKPATTSAFYPSGFALTPTMIGSRYDQTVVPPFNGGNAYCSILTSSSNATLISSTTSLLSLSPTKFGAAPLPGPIPNPNQLTLTITPGTGLFSGSFITNGTKAAFKGVLFQKQSLGGGLFVNKTQSGSVLIETRTNSGPITTGSSH